MNFDLALQSIPKSVVDRFGCGSFRAHAAKFSIKLSNRLNIIMQTIKKLGHMK